jgi:hypothetical protein
MFSMAHKQPFLTYKFNKYLQQKTKTFTTKYQHKNSNTTQKKQQEVTQLQIK